MSDTDRDKMAATISNIWHEGEVSVNAKWLADRILAEFLPEHDRQIRAEVMDAIQAQVRLKTERLEGSEDWKKGVWALHGVVWHIIGAIRWNDRRES